MRVRRTSNFNRELDHELSGDGRPSRKQFEERLAGAVELTLSAFWADPTYVPLLDEEAQIYGVRTNADPTGIFPPGVFYARRVSDDVIELLGVDFDWEFWDQD